MAARIHRLLRKDRHEMSAAIRLLLLQGSLGPTVRLALLELLQTIEPDPWVYFMSNPISHREIVRRIARGERPGVTIVVWNIVLTYAEFGTGEIKASRQQIAEDAGTSVMSVSRAMNRLVEIGALVKEGHGRFVMNPHINWIGPLDERRKKATELKVVEPA
jgi:CRP-like cAMP-binding protein